MLEAGGFGCLHGLEFVEYLPDGDPVHAGGGLVAVGAVAGVAQGMSVDVGVLRAERTVAVRKSRAHEDDAACAFLRRQSGNEAVARDEGA